MPPPRRSAESAVLNGGASSTNHKLIMLAKRPLKLEPKEVSRHPASSNSRPDAYRKELNDQQAAWAGRKYHSHRLLPPSWRKDLEAAHLSEF